MRNIIFVAETYWLTVIQSSCGLPYFTSKVYIYNQILDAWFYQITNYSKTDYLWQWMVSNELSSINQQWRKLTKVKYMTNLQMAPHYKIYCTKTLRLSFQHCETQVQLWQQQKQYRITPLEWQHHMCAWIIPLKFIYTMSIAWSP